jgi:hypothetical protein
VRDLLIDAIVDDSADVPEGARARSIGIEKEQRARIGGCHFEIESCDVVAIDALFADRQRDVTQTSVADFGDKCGGYFGCFSQVEERSIPFFG